MDHESFIDGCERIADAIRSVEGVMDEWNTHKFQLFTAAYHIMPGLLANPAYAVGEGFRGDRAVTDSFLLASALMAHCWPPKEPRPRAACPDSEVGAPDVPHDENGDVVDLSDAADPRNPLGDE